MLAERTPGTVLILARSCRKKARHNGSVPYFEGGRVILKVKRWPVSNPGLTPITRTKLRMSKPEPVSRTRAKPNCATTKALRAKARRFAEEEPRPPSLRVSEIRECAEMKEGRKPKSKPARSV